MTKHDREKDDIPKDHNIGFTLGAREPCELGQVCDSVVPSDSIHPTLLVHSQMPLINSVGMPSLPTRAFTAKMRGMNSNTEIKNNATHLMSAAAEGNQQASQDLLHWFTSSFEQSLPSE